MARTGRPKIGILTLRLEERTALERLSARPRSARNLAFRAKIILRCADSGKSNTDVGRELRASRGTVAKWRSRFIADRLDGLHDEPRPGAARKITDDAVEAVVTKTLESTPRGRTHWSTRSMAKNVGLSHSSIGRIWRAFGFRKTLSSSRKCATSSGFI